MPTNEDTMVQLPIRLRSIIADDASNDIGTHQDEKFDERGHEISDDSDSDLLQAMLTPEATSSDEDDAELSRMVDHLSSQSNAERIETIHEATREGNIDVVKDKLKILNIAHEASDSRTSLVSAINHVQLDIVRYLLERGANVHHRVKGLPPIVYAVLNGTPQFIQLLLDYGADPRSTSNTEEYNTLHFAVMHGKIDAADLLISKGVDLEGVCLGGRTALLLAAEKGQTVIAKLLLAKGAELHHTCSMGRTALAFAARNNHLETVRYLLKQGLGIEDSDDTGISKSKALTSTTLVAWKLRVYLQPPASSYGGFE
jgi:ankyrin repeat protein